ncbi:fluoride efflux transporter FluC [Clostridium merdae]|uniref:fluoride efflux transporter FluC n=1 Tax=Clostridium merdae TaxID=1958780 RepID=UPI000A270EED|nr:CrcB family protein [Clostridium merdae]
MKKILFLTCGSALGAVVRYQLENITLGGYHGLFPLNTLVINLSGAFLISFIFTVWSEVRAFDTDLRLGLTTGLMGAYTTFSTLCKEASTLLFAAKYFTAFCYLSASLLLGLGAVYLGMKSARALGLLLQKNPNMVTEKEQESDCK